MGRIKHICETCKHWNREKMLKGTGGPFARCNARIYTRYWNDKCQLWQKYENTEKCSSL